MIILSSLLFSLNATIPIFLVMVVGYILKNTHSVTPEFIDGLNKFNYKLTLPVLLFKDLATVNFYSVWDTKYFLFCFFATIFSIFSIWIIAGIILHLRKKANSPSILGEFVQSSYRGSAAVLGIAFIENIYGNSVIGPLMILATVPLYNIMAVTILMATNPSKDNSLNKASQIKNTLLGIAKNPIIISILLGMCVSLLRIHFPQMIIKTLSLVSQLATPLALISLGGSFEGRKAVKMIVPTLIASFVKLLLWPAMFLPLAISLGFRCEALVAILIMAGAPATASGYIMSRQLGHEGHLTSSIVVVTTFLSSVTLTAWIYILRLKGFI